MYLCVCERGRIYLSLLMDICKTVYLCVCVIMLSVFIYEFMCVSINMGMCANVCICV